MTRFYFWLCLLQVSMYGLAMVSISQDRGTAATPLVRNRWPSLFVVCIGVMMTFVNASSTIGALASIQDDLHVPGSSLVWVTSAFALALVSLVMSAGTFAELYGRRLTYVSGVAIFTGGSCWRSWPTAPAS